MKQHPEIIANEPIVLMKTVLVFLFLILISGYSIAQSTENYRSRNNKLNRNYQKKINSKKHQVATYQSNKDDNQASKLRKNHKTVNGYDPEKLVIKNSTPSIEEAKSKDFQKQKTTLRGSNKKSGRRLINYLTMMLAFSLILVAQ